MNNKMKIIPIFVPHVGCKFDCVFCNQKRITGKGTVNVNKQYAIDIVEEYRKTIDENTLTEIAFFGGSFTAIEKELQEELLQVGHFYKKLGIVQKIRMSTRPDAIDEDILKLQKKYNVDIIELGIQSLDDEVLLKANRGHTRQDCFNASKLIKEYGFTLGHQVMPGLPGSTRESDIKTCVDSISMKPHMVRIYPTLIIKDTNLLYMYEDGTYIPLTVQEAVDVTSYIYSLYMVNNINVIRIGLQNTESINEGEDVVGGPFHPAFRQLVEEKIYFTSIYNILKDKNIDDRQIKILANNKEISNICGQNKANIIKLKNIFNIKKVSFEISNDNNIIEIYINSKKLGSFNKHDIYKNYLNN
ncbi:MAG: radical SAM protein [Tissierellia bacterium]|nr:radical SAM protein [Tissierellia bacterium]